MKRIMFLLALLCLEKTLHAQTPHTPYIYTIKADSVKITNTCDTAELIIENHTQTVPGFLYNKGKGRTEFRRPLTKIDDSIYTVGIDTLKLSVAWLQGGNRFGTTGKFGTRDNNHIDFYTNDIKRGRWTNTGNLLIGTETDNGYNLAVGGTTYSQFFTNLPTPFGDLGGGALRLRWGNLGGEYIGFYNWENNHRRGLIASGADGRPLYIKDDIGFSFSNTPFVAVGVEWGTGQAASSNSRLFVGSHRSTGWNSFSIKGLTNDANDSEGEIDFRVTAVGNTILGGDTDNGFKLQVNGTTYSQIFTNSPTPLGNAEGGPVRLRWNGPSGKYLSFYFQDKNEERGYIGAQAERRPLIIFDSIGVTVGESHYLSVGLEDNQGAKLSVANPLNSTLDVFCATSAEAGGYRTGLTVKKSGNTVIGDSYFDFGHRLQVMGSAFIRDTLKMPNLVSQTDASNYRPVVADASGNVYKMAGWNMAATRKSATVTASIYTVPADVDVVFVNSSGTATVILPSGTLDREITIKNLNATDSVVLSGLNNSESNTIATHGAIIVKYTGSTWVGISKY
jgi:hypothetical protein